MKTPNEHYRNKDAQVEQGFIFSLMPEISRNLHTEGIAVVAHDMTNERLEVTAKCNFDFDAGDIAEQVWTNIRKAEVIVADLTNYDPQVMCEVGISLGIKDAKKIVLLRDAEKVEQGSESPIDLRNLEVTSYKRNDLNRFKNDLRDRLRDSMGAGPAPPPLPTLEDRQIVEEAMNHTKNKNWNLAGFLFKQIDQKLENNWYILTQWGIMYREKADYAKAHELFQRAARYASYDEYKSSVYIEQAILASRQQNTERAEALFESARNADAKNRNLYIAWADVYDKLETPESALAQIAELMKVLGRDDEALILTDFYTQKVRDPGFSMKLGDFKKAWHLNRPSTGTAADIGPKPSQSSAGARRVPKQITWHAFRNQFKGALVEGEVHDTHPTMGVFVYLNPELKGLIYSTKAGPDYQKRFREGQKVRVRIRNIFIKPNGTRAIDLVPA